MYCCGTMYMYYSPQRQAHPHGLLYAELGPMPASKRNTQSQKKPSQYVDVLPQDTPQTPTKAPEKGELSIILRVTLILPVTLSLFFLSYHFFFHTSLSPFRVS